MTTEEITKKVQDAGAAYGVVLARRTTATGRVLETQAALTAAQDAHQNASTALVKADKELEVARETFFTTIRGLEGAPSPRRPSRRSQSRLPINPKPRQRTANSDYGQYHRSDRRRDGCRPQRPPVFAPFSRCAGLRAGLRT